MTSGTDTRHTLKLSYFVGLSMLVHALIIGGVTVPLPQRAMEPLPLIARLQPAEPPLPVWQRPRRQRAPTIEPVFPTPAAAVSTPELVPAPVTATPEFVATPAASAVPELVPMPQAMSESARVEASPTVPSTVEESVSPPAVAVVARLPRKGEITYTLYHGVNRLTVGRTVQSWEIHDDNYRLLSISETSGLAALFSRQRLAYESRGKLTARGLQPQYFTVQRVRSGKRQEAVADFDWKSMTATIGNPQFSVALPVHAQDIVSFMYQLGLTPLAPGQIELPIINGWKLEHYKLEIGSEEQLLTPFGTLRALPVKQVRRSGQESIELWLAPEYRFLPVRIRFFDRRGEPSGEQLVSDIRVSTD